ncbi:RidA family protein [Halorubrum sp. 48-1-W]|uniref:RidA family protein n=1 Tax=Halorubrum sp. 48-1-W TaxID=2249761 RepID=UPI000DCCEAF8|nr:Rid family detoxifying hydrolase [Halorubrum sp. 48-1-W]RAW46907.1 RidA family protein [Halorubrum sp. 48-1-W]
MVRHISTDAGYDSDFPFSQGVIHGDTVYTAGQIPKDPETREVVGETIAEQTHQTFDNIEAVLEAAGTSLENVVKVTAFLTDMDDIEAFNRVYRDRMPAPYPGRSTVEVAALAIDITVEIEMIAAID